jgi:hypothetical protein
LVDFPEGDMVHLSSEAFKNMEMLRVLIVKSVMYLTGECGPTEPPTLYFPRGGPTFLPEELRMLVWRKCPLESFPSNFQGNKLIILIMPRSALKSLKGVEVQLLFLGKLCHHPIVLLPFCFGLNFLGIETFSNLMNFIFVLWKFVNRDLN